MLFVVIIVFIIQWTPFVIIELIAIAPGRTEINPIGPERVSVNMVAFLNAVLNPIVFGFMSKPFRKGFRDAWAYFVMCKFCRGARFNLSRSNINVANSSAVNLTSSTQCDIDWERSFNKLNKHSNPISIVEEIAVPQTIDQTDCVRDPKL